MINLEDRYTRFADAHRKTVLGRLQWKGPEGRQSLYRMIDGNGNGSSLGPRSPETEAMYEDYILSRDKKIETEKQLKEQFRQWRNQDLDDSFEHNLPEELKQYFNEWKTRAENDPSPLGKKIKM